MATLVTGSVAVATKLVPKKFTFTASGITTLSAALGYTRPHTWVKSVTMRTARLNANNVEWGDSIGERGGYLEPGEACTIDWGEGQTFAEEFNLFGTSGDIIYLSVDVNRYYWDNQL